MANFRSKAVVIERQPVPKTKGEARNLIRKIFDDNRWDRDEQNYYQRSLDLPEIPLIEMDIDQMRVIMRDLAKARMVIFEEEN